MSNKPTKIQAEFIADIARHGRINVLWGQLDGRTYASPRRTANKYELATTEACIRHGWVKKEERYGWLYWSLISDVLN